MMKLFFFYMIDEEIFEIVKFLVQFVVILCWFKVNGYICVFKFNCMLFILCLYFEQVFGCVIVVNDVYGCGELVYSGD